MNQVTKVRTTDSTGSAVPVNYFATVSLLVILGMNSQQRYR